MIAFHGVGDLGLDSDDPDYLNNAALNLQDPWRLTQPQEAFPAGRPTTELFFFIGYSIWGADPSMFHIALVALHFGAALLFAIVLLQMGARPETAILAAVLFLLNVAHYRAVHWISCVAYPLSMIFGLCTLIGFRRYLSTGRWSWHTITLVCQMTAVGAHPVGICFCAYSIYLGWRNGHSRIATRALPLVVSTGFIAGLLAVLYAHTPPMVTAFHPPDAVHIFQTFTWFWGRLWTQAHWIYPDLSYPPLWEQALGGLIMLVSVYAIFRQRAILTRDGVVWAVLALIPFSNIYSGPSRYLYLASAGSSLILAHCLTSCLGGQKGRLVSGFTAGLLILLSLISLQRAKTVSFYASGRSYIAQGDFTSGKRQLEKSLTYQPDLLPLDMYFRLATVSFIEGIPQTEILKNASERFPGNVSLLCVLGLSETLEKDPDIQQKGAARVEDAVAYFETHKSLFENVTSAFTNLGMYYARKGHLQHSENMLQIPLHFKPEDAKVLYNMGLAKFMQEKPGADPFFEAAVNKEPVYISYLIDYADTLFWKQNHARAHLIYRFVANLQLEKGDIFYSRGMLALIKEQFPVAIEEFQKASSYTPVRPHVYLGLSEAYKATLQPEKAQNTYQEFLDHQSRF